MWILRCATFVIVLVGIWTVGHGQERERAVVSGIANTQFNPSKSDFRCVSFKKHSAVTKMQLAAAYLLKPEVADRADVIWGYSINEPRLQDKLKKKPENLQLYFKLKGKKDFTVLNSEASRWLLWEAGSPGELTDVAKKLGLEVGVALRKPKFQDIEPQLGMINWNKSTGGQKLKFKPVQAAPSAVEEFFTCFDRDAIKPLSGRD